MCNNIQLSYLYRDASNYKNFGTVIFANKDNLLLEKIEHAIKAKLIDGCWFYAEEWGLPDVRFPETKETDPTWHEFESMEYTDLQPNTALSLDELIPLIEKSSQPIV